MNKKCLAKISINHHPISCIIGVFPNERIEPQTIYMDFEVEADISEAVKSDSITEAFDYVKLAELCTQLAQEKKFFLLETLAYEAVQLLLQQGVEWACVKVKKLKEFAQEMSGPLYSAVEFQSKRER